MTAPLTYNVPEAASRLGASFTADWLYKHLGEIPHGRTGDGTGRGGRIYFTDDDLREIVARYARKPAAKTPPRGHAGPVTRRRAS